MKFQVTLTLNWVTDSGKNVTSKELYIGKVGVASVFYDSTMSALAKNKYRVTTKMSGMKSDLGLFLTEELAKEHAEKVAKYWIENKLTA